MAVPRILVAKDGLCMLLLRKILIWSPSRKNRTTWRIAWNSVEIPHFESWVSPWFFLSGFFPGKVWLCSVQKWALHWAYPKMVRTVRSSLSFRTILWFGFFAKGFIIWTSAYPTGLWILHTAFICAREWFQLLDAWVRDSGFENTGQHLRTKFYEIAMVTVPFSDFKCGAVYATVRGISYIGEIRSAVSAGCPLQVHGTPRYYKHVTSQITTTITNDDLQLSLLIAASQIDLSNLKSL